MPLVLVQVEIEIPDRLKNILVEDNDYMNDENKYMVSALQEQCSRIE